MQTFTGVSSNEKIGFSVSLNGNGNIVAFSREYLNYGGQVQVWEYSNSDMTDGGSWSQLDVGITNALDANLSSGSSNNYGGDRFGICISLNNDGNLLAVGLSYGNTQDGNQNTAGFRNHIGRVHVYEYANSSWSKVQTQLAEPESDGDTQSSQAFGYSVSFNDSGSNFVAGAPWYDSGASQVGRVLVYETGFSTVTTNTINVHAVPPDLISDSVSIVSNNSNTIKAKEGDEVTLSFEYDLSINTPMVSFKSNGQDITDTSIDYVGTNDNTSWTAKYTVDSADSDGAVTFTIDASAQTTLTDATQLTESDITDGTNVIIDTTVPTITNTVISNDNLNLSVTFSEKISGSSTFNDTAMVFNVTVNGDLNGGGNYIISGGNITDPTQTNHAINCNAGQTIVFSMATTDYNSYKLGIGDGPNYNQILSVNLDDTDSRFSTTVDGDNTLISFTPTENSSEWYYYCAQDPYPNGWGAQITVSNGIETTDFTLSLTGGSSATLQSNTPTNITTLDNLTYDMSLNISGVATGEETLSIVPASSTSIYDAAGNAMSTTQSNNTVNLTDLALPTINSLTISSNNSIKTNYAGENDIVTLYITASEDIIEPTVVFKSNDVVVTNAVSYSGAGDSWTAQYTVSSEDTNGVISFELNVEDVAGNTNQRTLTTDSSSVTKVGNASVLTYTSTTAGDQVGTTKLGNAQSSAGTGIAISGDGKKMAVPAYQNRDAPAGNYAGAMQVWEYNSSTEDWDTFGSDGTKTDGFIYGKQSFGEAGTGYAMNKAGDIVVLGEPKNDTDGNVSQANFDGTNTGKVHVYKYNSNNDLWEQMGDDIIGKNNSEFSGISVSINAIGNIIVIGSPGGNSAAGLVRVYKYSDISVTNGTWEQLGGDTTGDIEGVNSNEESGHSVSLNSDGDIVAVGAPQYGTGRVRIWKYSDISVTNGTWTQLSTDIVGSNSNGKTGFSVSLNDVGDIIAIGSPYANNNAGEVSVYQYSDISITNGSWTKLSGNNITGSGLFGDEVSLNGQGNMVAIGAPNSHKAYVYEYSDLSITNGTWSEILELSGSNDNFGSGVALNTSGSYVAVGAQQNTGGAGAGFVYETGVQTTVTTFIHAVPPELVSDSVSIVSNNYDTTKAKAIDEVTLSFEYDLSVNTPMVSFFSDGVNVTDSEIDYVGTNDNTSWTAKYTVDSADTDGVVTFTIDASAQTTLTDATQLTESDITDGTNVTVDTTIPTITGTTISSNNVNLQVTFSEFVVNNSSYTDAGLSYTVTANGSSNYILNGSGLTDSAKPSISLFVGQTVTFSVSNSVNNSHPLIIGTV